MPLSAVEKPTARTTKDEKARILNGKCPGDESGRRARYHSTLTSTLDAAAHARRALAVQPQKQAEDRLVSAPLFRLALRDGCK